MEPLRPGAAFLVLVPVPAGGQLQALGGIEAKGVNVIDEHHQAGQVLPGVGQAELFGRGDGVDRIGCGVGQADDVGPGALCLQDVGREVTGGQRVAGLADDLAAGGGDRALHVGLHGVAECVVGREDEPLVATFLDDGPGRAIGHRVGVVHPVDVVGRAVLVGDGRRRGDRHQAEPVGLLQDAGHGDGDGR
ncbi:hypothetical protein D3C84_434660 [compost metagenome]